MSRKSKYRPDIVEDLKPLAKAAETGLTSEVIAEFLGINKDTLYEWFKKYPGLKDQIDALKEPQDEAVKRALFQRATGYKAKETKIFYDKGEIVEKEVIKALPPDTTACIFWLKNRQPDDWRDVRERVNTNKNEYEDTPTLEVARRLANLLTEATQTTH
jgi:DNA-binding XRE family transcriptional regulator